MIDSITYDESINMQNMGRYHELEQYISSCNIVSLVFIVNEEILGSVEKESSIVTVSRELDTIEIYAGHDQSTIIKLSLYNLYRINMYKQDKTMVVAVKTIIREEKIIERSIL